MIGEQVGDAVSASRPNSVVGTVRVLHVIPSIARNDGGPSEVIRQLIPTLAECGVAVTVISTDKNLTDRERSSLPFAAILARSRRTLRSANFATGLVAPLFRETRRCDVVHVHGVDSYIGSVAMLMSRLWRKPIVLEPHGALSAYQRRQRFWRKAAYRLLVDRGNFRAVDDLIVSSQLEADDAGDAFPRTPTSVVPLGIDGRILTTERISIATDTPFLLFLGRVTAKKRLDLVIEALALLSSEHPMRLVVAGPIDPGLHFDPARLGAELGLTERIDFLGSVDQPRRECLLASAFAFVLLSDDESFGIAAAEAMGAGCPTIVSSRVGLVSNFPPEPNGADGFIICQQSPEALAAAVARLTLDRDHRELQSASGRARAAANFRWSVSASRMRVVYEGALKGGAKC